MKENINEFKEKFLELIDNQDNQFHPLVFVNVDITI